jgi:sugar phosphate isomerase/epimerase
MHGRLSVSGLCFPGLDLDQTLAQLGALGARQTTLQSSQFRAGGWDAGIEKLHASGLSVAALIAGPPFQLGEPGTWHGTRALLIESVDAAAALGAGAIYTVTGRRPGSWWAESVEAFSDAVHPVLEHARRVGVRVCVEPTNPLYSDMSFVHSLASALELVERLDVGVCLDVFHVWTEAHLEHALARGVDRIALVQVSDHVPGDRSFPCRAVPGDGSVPLREILGVLFAAGYAGAVDVELSGPRIDAEGHASAARRAVAHLDDLLRVGTADRS